MPPSIAFPVVVSVVPRTLPIIVNQVRDDRGAYMAVSSRGEFFSRGNPVMIFGFRTIAALPIVFKTWSLIIQEDITKGIWMTLNGGKLLLSPGTPDLTSDGFDFVEADIKMGGYGITHLAWRSPNEVWAVGGSNTMYVSFDGGKKFSFDKSANDIPGNLYNVKFFPQFNNMGWALGSNGVLLRYAGESS